MLIQFDRDVEMKILHKSVGETLRQNTLLGQSFQGPW